MFTHHQKGKCLCNYGFVIVIMNKVRKLCGSIELQCMLRGMVERVNVKHQSAN